MGGPLVDRPGRWTNPAGCQLALSFDLTPRLGQAPRYVEPLAAAPPKRITSAARLAVDDAGLHCHRPYAAGGVNGRSTRILPCVLGQRRVQQRRGLGGGVAVQRVCWQSDGGHGCRAGGQGGALAVVGGSHAAAGGPTTPSPVLTLRVQTGGLRVFQQSTACKQAKGGWGGGWSRRAREEGLGSGHMLQQVPGPPVGLPIQGHVAVSINRATTAPTRLRAGPMAGRCPLSWVSMRGLIPQGGQRPPKSN